MPNLDWQLYNVPVIDTETFRVTNNWNIEPVYRLNAYLGQFFGTVDEVLISNKVYPFKEIKSIVNLVIPKDLREAGITIRYIGIKLGYPRVELFNYDWQVTVDEYL